MVTAQALVTSRISATSGGMVPPNGRLYQPGFIALEPGKRQLVILNETLEKALAASGDALPAGIDLVLSGHIHLWEAIGFADKRPPQFVLGSGGTDLAHAIKGTLTGLPMGGARAAFGRSEHVWGFTRFTPANAGGWDATFFDEKNLPRASCTVARGEVGCK